MTDDTPVPPWLRSTGVRPSGAERFIPERAFWTNVTFSRSSSEPMAKLDRWLRWRSELAAALGLVDREVLREKMLACRRGYGDERAAAFNAISDAYEATFGEAAPPSGASQDTAGRIPPPEFFYLRHERQAVAAELRAQADAIESEAETQRLYYSEVGALALSMIRARADELDPAVPDGPPLKPVLTLQTTTGNVSELLSDSRAVWSNPGGPAVTVTIGSADDPKEKP